MSPHPSFSFGQLSAFHVEGMIQPIQSAIIAPEREITVHCAARWQILRNGSPLTTGAEDLHQAVDHFAHSHRALIASRLGRRNFPFDDGPLLIGEITGVTQLAAIITTTIIVRPHWAAPANRTTTIESQVIPMIQDVMGQTLNNLAIEAIEAEAETHFRRCD